MLAVTPQTVINREMLQNNLFTSPLNTFQKQEIVFTMMKCEVSLHVWIQITTNVALCSTDRSASIYLIELLFKCVKASAEGGELSKTLDPLSAGP